MTSFILRLTAIVFFTVGYGFSMAATAQAAVGDNPAVKSPPKLDNATCQSCHDGKSETYEVPGPDGEMRPLLVIEPTGYQQSIHAGMECISCHKEIVDDVSPHQLAPVAKPDCVQCHKDLSVQNAKEGKQGAERDKVVQNSLSYDRSFHAQPHKEIPNRPRATCDDCHDSHFFNVPPKGSPEREGEWRLGAPTTCAAKCHAESLEYYSESVHGLLLTEEKDPKGAICSDCHTSHEERVTTADEFKVLITKECGNCHKENFGSYADTYHGKINRLGYGYTAKCHDCHGSHSILKVDDPYSAVHPKNRLNTCSKCHDGGESGRPKATEGFVSFAPHANAFDFKRYPQVAAAYWFMILLLVGTFGFFWIHSVLWFYREYQDRKEHRSRAHVATEALPGAVGKQVYRFGPVSRIAHLVFGVSDMTLVLTGLVLLFAGAAWAPVLIKLLGGPQITGLIHRSVAVIFVSVLLLHILYLIYFIFKNLKTFRWFGPDSLVPNWKDMEDIVGMFKWFVGKGPKPQFDRWTYWEKFDYWAVFWGVGAIGITGLMLWFPTVVASFLPGWTLNVAAVIHSKQALLGAVFLFTVHFFNVHLRPEKFPPPDVVMFTGSVDLDEFRRERPAQYQRLRESGQLEKYLVDQPSRPMTIGSKLLGLSLIGIGFVILVLLVNGAFTG